MPTFTVTDVLGSNEWAPPDDPSKKTIFWNFKAQEVDKVCSIGRKPGNELKVGEVIEATSSEDRGKLKLKRIAQGNGFGGGGSKDYKADPAKLRGEAMRSAIHAASGYVTAMAAVDRVPASFFESFENYKSLDPMIRHWYGLILEAQAAS